MGNFTAYMDQFGYIVLFASLLLELIALPLPGEVLMSYTGFLIYQGNLNWLASILIGGTGASIGMTLSYWIGFKLGKPFFEKYGHRFHMGPDKIEKTSHWFTKHGNKLLVFAYFIPGVRHITGYFSGITRLPFRTNYSNEYYNDPIQGIPVNGYADVFTKLLSSSNITTLLNTDYFQIKNKIPRSMTIIFTGPIDRFFNYKHGGLRWRALKFESETIH